MTLLERLEESETRYGPLVGQEEWRNQVSPLAEQIRASALAGGGGPHDERHWGLVREQFAIAPEEVYLNTGSLGLCSRWVMLQVHRLREYQERHPTEGAGHLGREAHAARGKMASLLHTAAENVVFTHNTTSALELLAFALDLRSGDIVLTSDHEHPGGSIPWERAADRHGVTREVVPLPTNGDSSFAGETLDRFDAAFRRLREAGCASGKRILSISHIPCESGLILPVQELSAMAREYGFLSYVDGAQAVGMVDVDVEAIGCDFYATSPHKWLAAPKGTGVLYARPEAQSVFSSLVPKGRHGTNGWGPGSFAGHLAYIGTGDLAVHCGLGLAVDFVELIGGIRRVQKRVWALAYEMRRRLTAVPGVELVTPLQEEDTAPEEMRSCGLTVFGLEHDPGFCQHLQQEWGLRVRWSAHGTRVSTHYYNTWSDVDHLVDTVARAAAKPRPEKVTALAASG